MLSLESVPVTALPLERFRDVLAPSRWRRVEDAIGQAGELLADRVVWNINSTARGGGVAELLRSLVGYARGVGVDARWMAIGGDAPFFEITKRLHNRMHGNSGDGGDLGPAQRDLYESALRVCGEQLRGLIAADDIVILHDPQTAGLVPALKETGARVAWRSHIGEDTPDELALEAWRFLLGWVTQADTCIFSRPEYAWSGLDRRKLTFIHPSIDVFSPKNEQLEPDEVAVILAAAGIVDAGGHRAARFERTDGRSGHVRRAAQVVEDSRLRIDTEVILQVSRWDHLKDPLGVLEGFASHVANVSQAHLVLAGPAAEAVADDPEGPAVLAEVTQAWSRLDARTRARVHLLALPMDDIDENAVIVNALQRQARVVCQKSIAEGFGITVAEAMWKGRPVVASRVGGIQDQIVQGVSGILLDDARDLASFGAAVSGLLGEPDRAARIGVEAERRARDRFIAPEHLLQYFALFKRLLAGSADRTARHSAQPAQGHGPPQG